MEALGFERFSSLAPTHHYKLSVNISNPLVKRRDMKSLINIFNIKYIGFLHGYDDFLKYITNVERQ